MPNSYFDNMAGFYGMDAQQPKAKKKVNATIEDAVAGLDPRMTAMQATGGGLATPPGQPFAGAQPISPAELRQFAPNLVQQQQPEALPMPTELGAHRMQIDNAGVPSEAVWNRSGLGDLAYAGGTTGGVQADLTQPTGLSPLEQALSDQVKHGWRYGWGPAGLGFQAQLGQMADAPELDLKERQLQQQAELAGKDISSRENLATRSLESEAKRAAERMEFEEYQGELNRRAQRELASLNRGPGARVAEMADNAAAQVLLNKGTPAQAQAARERIMAGLNAPAATAAVSPPQLSPAQLADQIISSGLSPDGKVSPEKLAGAILSKQQNPDLRAALVNQINQLENKADIEAAIGEQFARRLMMAEGQKWAGGAGGPPDKIYGPGGIELYEESAGPMDWIGKAIAEAGGLADPLNRLRLPTGRILQLPTPARSSYTERAGLSKEARQKAIEEQSALGKLLMALSGQEPGAGAINVPGRAPTLQVPSELLNRGGLIGTAYRNLQNKGR